MSNLRFYESQRQTSFVGEDTLLQIRSAATREEFDESAGRSRFRKNSESMIAQSREAADSHQSEVSSSASFLSSVKGLAQSGLR